MQSGTRGTTEEREEAREKVGEAPRDSSARTT